MPKDYQVSQYDQPINVDGWLELPDGKRVGIERAHLEEDTGKSTHVGGGGRIHGAEYSLVDYNRAGVPLLEIVSRPDMRTCRGGRPTSSELRAILLATGVSDAKMEEGSMRVDANVSVRPGRQRRSSAPAARSRTSTPSARSAGPSSTRLAARSTSSKRRAVRQETRHWDEADGRTHTLRSKEDAEDYRYFPEPDLVPVEPDAGVARAGAFGGHADAAGRPAGAAGPAWPASTPPSRRWSWRWSAARTTGARRHRRRGDPARVLVHVEHNLVADGGPVIDPPSARQLTQLEVAGKLTATQAKQVLADWSPPAATRGRGGRRRASRPWTAPRWRPPSTRPSPIQPAIWQKYRRW
jgi:aspartyl-tRNA(Asn)/glutamyl-tRNA(Gln) amidotransferase subunit B